MDTQPSLPIPFASFSLNYIPLPADYPILPLNAQQCQPAAYTQGELEAIYVTIVLPLPDKMCIELPDGVSFTEGGVHDIYKCVIQLGNDVESDPDGRLAMISFSINISEGMNPAGHWEIEVLDAPGEGDEGNEGTLGKVVMDANMLPTFEPKA